MKLLGFVNFWILQWFFVRIAFVYNKKDDSENPELEYSHWYLMRGVYPITGWFGIPYKRTKKWSKTQKASPVSERSYIEIMDELLLKARYEDIIYKCNDGTFEFKIQLVQGKYPATATIHLDSGASSYVGDLITPIYQAEIDAEMNESRHGKS